MDEIHQCPNCEALIYPAIFYLAGARFLHGVPNPNDYTQQEKWEDAQRLWEHRILQSATELQTTLIYLMEIAEKEGLPQDAQFCADTCQQVSHLLHMTK